ncbi:reverse transcriptase domain-containing protein [Tanacetum coccineum]
MSTHTTSKETVKEFCPGMISCFEKIKHILYQQLSRKYQVKYATFTLLNMATNLVVLIIRGPSGTDGAFAMTWRELMKLMAKVYCPRTRIQKMKSELWNLTRIRKSLAANTQKISSLTMMSTKMVLEERIVENSLEPEDNQKAQPTHNKRHNVEGHPFNIDLMPVELGSFDVIIGMDWLANHHAVIVCDEKIVWIPYGDEVLIIQGDKSNKGKKSKLSIISCTKTQKYIKKGCPIFLVQITKKETEDKLEEKQLEDVPIVRDFPKVFPKDMPRLPPTRQVEFQIDLVPGAAPVARAPYRLAPSELQELSTQLQELSDKGDFAVVAVLEFDIEIKDRKGTENVAADHLSQIENDESSDDSDVDDNFPRETLMEINTKDEPWFADFANYLFEYILVAVDYVSKWAEAQALSTNDARVVITFLKKLFCRFKMPKALISDRGTHFCNKITEKMMKRYAVNHRFSTSYHPQTSGQVENTNKAFKRILKKTVKGNPAIWSRKLDDALWAFRTAYKTPTGTTPYKLIYGKNCHLPFEIEHRAYWALKNCNPDLIAAGGKKNVPVTRIR